MLIATPGRLQTSVDRLHHRDVSAAGALSGDEPQHVRRHDLGRSLLDHPEEHLQVIGRGQHRVRAAPALEELQIVVDHRLSEPDCRISRGSSRADQTWIGQGHLEASSSIDRQPQRLLEMS